MLADRAQANAKRYHEIFAEAIDSVLEDPVLLPPNPEVLERRGEKPGYLATAAAPPHVNAF